MTAAASRHAPMSYAPPLLMNGQPKGTTMMSDLDDLRDLSTLMSPWIAAAKLLGEHAQSEHPETVVLRGDVWGCAACGAPAPLLTDMPQRAVEAGSAHVVTAIVHNADCGPASAR